MFHWIYVLCKEKLTRKHPVDNIKTVTDRNGLTPGLGNFRDAARRVSKGVSYTDIVYLLFFLAQLLVTLVTELRES